MRFSRSLFLMEQNDQAGGERYILSTFQPITMATLTELVKPGNVAVVTGASSGIGRAAALRWAAAGMHVYMLDIDAAELQTALKMVQEACQEGGTATAVAVDVSDEVALKKVADDVFASHGTCHILFNNAGIGLGGGALTDT